MTGTSLEVCALTKQFAGLTAVNRVDMQVMRGELRGLIGPNGSGKTTLLNLLSGVLKPTSGEMRLQGESLAGLRAHQIAARGIARTFQNLRVFRSMTALENVLAGRHRHVVYGVASLLCFRHRGAERSEREKALTLLRFVHLDGKADVKAGALAYGEQRRLELARALATEPHTLLLDEPLAGMNPAEGDQMIGLFQAIQQQAITIVLVEHSMRAVMRVCNPITVLNFGTKIAEGTPAEIRSNPQVVEAYLGREGKLSRARRPRT